VGLSGRGFWLIVYGFWNKCKEKSVGGNEWVTIGVSKYSSETDIYVMTKTGTYIL